MSGGLSSDIGHGLDSDYAENLTKKMGEILNYLQSQGCPKQIHAAVILGSGLGEYTEALELTHSIPYSEIPSFPQSTVEGHSGALIFGELQGRTIMAFSGRFHFMKATELTKQ
jgi:purine-nucleoside phosphorylase